MKALTTMKTITIKHEVEIIDGLRVGKATQHPDGRLVYVVDGAFLRGGRVSNFWRWREIKPDGSLGEGESGYGWSNG